MKRVLHISKYYFPFRGGTEKVARDCVLALKDGCEQRVVCFNHRPGTRVDTVDGVEVTRVGCFAKVASQSLSLSYGRRLRALLQDFRPDVVIFHYPNPFVARYLLKYLPATSKLVVYWHLDIVRQRLLGRLFHGQNLRLARRAALLIATSRSYAQASPYLRAEAGKCAVVPNSIDVDALRVDGNVRRAAQRIAAENAGRVLCFAVGRHVAYKGYDRLIQASQYLDDRFRIVIAGEGKLTPSLVRQAAGDDRIRFAGRVDDETLKAYMAAMDIFCFPSVTRNEAFGVALAEAMYFGKPAVTFTIPGSGVNEVCLDGEDGIEAPNGDARAYAAALRRLADDPQLRARLGRNGRRRVEENFLYAQFERRVRALVDGL